MVNKPVRFSKQFRKEHKRFPARIQSRYMARLTMWRKNPFHPLLNHHVLTGEFEGYHSISIGGDLRALYRETEEVIVFERIGTHHQLYGK